MRTRKTIFPVLIYDYVICLHFLLILCLLELVEPDTYDNKGESTLLDSNNGSNDIIYIFVEGGNIVLTSTSIYTVTLWKFQPPLMKSNSDRVGNQCRIRRDCASVQSRLSLRCSRTWQ